MDHRPPSSTRRPVCIEDLPRLDLQRLVAEARASGEVPFRRHVGARWGVGVQVVLDLERRTLAVRVRGEGWQVRPLVRRGSHWTVRCIQCGRYVELLYWWPASPHGEDGACRRCHRLQRLASVVQGHACWGGAGAYRGAVRAGDVQALATAAQVQPSAGLRVRQALELEGHLPRRRTLDHGHVRRQAWREEDGERPRRRTHRGSRGRRKRRRGRGGSGSARRECRGGGEE